MEDTQQTDADDDADEPSVDRMDVELPSSLQVSRYLASHKTRSKKSFFCLSGFVESRHTDFKTIEKTKSTRFGKSASSQVRQATQKRKQ